MDASPITEGLNLALLAAEPRHEREIVHHVSKYAGPHALIFSDELIRAFGPQDGRTNIHFFGAADGQPVFLLGTNLLGQCEFSRILCGGHRRCDVVDKHIRSDNRCFGFSQRPTNSD